MKRIQRSRRDKQPPNTKYCGRPTAWGNPYPVSEYGREESVRLYREYAEKKLQKDPMWLDELKGYENLSCWCKPEEACHVDVIIDLLNQQKL